MAAGAAGSLAMSLFHQSLAPPPSKEEQRADSTVKTAGAIYRKVTGHDLADSQKDLAGPLVHYSFGALLGAVYGAAQPAASMGYGLPFGAAVWLGAHEIAVPSLGLAPPPTQEPLSSHATELAGHLIYGATVWAVWRVLRRKA